MTNSQKQQTTAVEWPTRPQNEWDLGSVTTEYCLNGKLSRRKLMFMKLAFEREIEAIRRIAAAFMTHQHTLSFSFIAKEEILKGRGQWGHTDDPQMTREAWEALMGRDFEPDDYLLPTDQTITAMAALILDKEMPVQEPEWPHIDVYDDAVCDFGDS